MGVGPLLPWRRLGGGVRAAGCGAGLVRGGRRDPARAAGAGAVATLMFGLAAFVGASTVSEMARSVRSHGARAAAPGPTPRPRPSAATGGCTAATRALGLLVAIARDVVGGSFADRSGEVSLEVGGSARVAGYELRLDGVDARQEPQRRVIVARVTVASIRGPEPDRRPVQPSLNLYPAVVRADRHAVDPGTARREGPVRELYASVMSVDESGRRRLDPALREPGDRVLWVGGLVTALGGASRPGRRAGGRGAPVAARGDRRAEAGGAGLSLAPEETEESERPPRRPRTLVVAAILLPVVAFAALFASGLGRDPRVLPSELVHERAPAFSLQRLDGRGTIDSRRSPGRSSS